MIFSFFLQISNHMWADQYTVRMPWSHQDPWSPNNNIDLDVFDRTLDFIAERKFNMIVIDVGDGVKLTSHSEIAAPDAWSIDFLRGKLDEIRARGIEPVPKLNFSCAHNVWQKEWRYRVGLPEYLPFCRDIIKEVSEIFDHPRFFHLGLDEETAEHQKTRGMSIVRNEPVFWEHAYALFDECEKNGARPWVFSDYYWHHPEVFEKKMPKSVIQSNWYYGAYDTRPDFPSRYRMVTFHRLDELGYDQIPVTSAFSNAQSPIQCMGYCKGAISPEHLLGFNAIPWHNTAADEYYSLIHDAERCWQGRKRYFPETV